MKKEVILVGAFHEIIELCELRGFKVIGIFDPNVSGTYHGYPILGNDEDADRLVKEFIKVPVIIVPDDPATRRRLSRYYCGIGYQIATLISPYARWAASASLGEGVVVQSGCNVSSCVRLGSLVRLNTNANIMHDCEVGDYSTVAPNAVLLGHVHVGVACYIGANATILPHCKIGDCATVGAGAVVTKDVQAGTIVVGNPARIFERHD